MKLGEKQIITLFVFLFLAFALPLSLFLVSQRQEIRKKATEGQTFTVCPSGTAGQNGCDYVGGDGIQQAVDAAAVGSSTSKTKILIKAGSYTRANYTEYINSYGKKRKCFVNTKEKFLIFEGEGGVILDGGHSANMSGFCAKGGEIEVKNLKIVGFKKDPDECPANDTQVCSRGFGIFLEFTAKATIQNNQISGNQYEGIVLWNSSQATIQNNQISENQGEGIYLGNSSQAKIINNTLYKNKVAGIEIYQCGDYNPSVKARNNIIIAHTEKYTDGIFGFGIGGDCLHAPGKLDNDTFAYNLIWGNEGDDTRCGGDELCENFTGRINADPKFVNPEGGDFHLQAGSPAINSGDPDISDPDGSRSDMGVYGGPGACGSDPNLPGCHPSGATPTPTPSPLVSFSCPVQPAFSGGCCGEPEPSSLTLSACANSCSNKTVNTNGTCTYTNNLKPCPDASCPAYWVPCGWSCNPENTAVRINSLTVNPYNPPSEGEDSRDVKIAWSIFWQNNTSDNCQEIVSVKVGPNPDNLKPAYGCPYLRWAPGAGTSCVTSTQNSQPACQGESDWGKPCGSNNYNWYWDGQSQICASVTAHYQKKSGYGGVCPNSATKIICYKPLPSGISPTPTPRPTATPTPTPRPTATPTPTPRPTFTPTPTPPPGEVKIKVKVKFAGVTEKRPGQKVKIKVGRISAIGATSILQELNDVILEADNSGVYESQTITLSSAVLKGSSYYLLLKGPKHLQVRFCQNSGQTRPCSKGDIRLENGENILDFTGYPLPGGDLPPQDGVVNAIDAVALTNCFFQTSAQCLEKADLNFDGIVNTMDMNIMNNTIYSRWEDE